MSKRTVLITGASGFIGKSLLQFLSIRRYKVIALCRNRPQVGANFRWVQLPARPEEMPATLEELRNIPFDCVVHAAGRIYGSSRDLYWANEFFLSLLVDLRFMRDKRFVLVSSMAAAEEENPYGDSKRNCEEILRRSEITNWSILRPGLVYGKYDNKNIANMIRFIRFSPLVLIPGANAISLQPLFIDDLCQAIEMHLSSPEGGQRTTELTGPDELKLMEVARVIRDTLKVKRLILPVPFRVYLTAILALKRLLFLTRIGFPDAKILRQRKRVLCHDFHTQFKFFPMNFEEGMRVVLQKEHENAD